MKTIITNKVHKIRLRPTPAQEVELRRSCAAARYAYNYGVEWLNAEYDIQRQFYNLSMPIDYNKKFSPISKKSFIGIKDTFNSIKDTSITAGTGTATQEAFQDLQKALSRYFDIQKGKIKLPPPKRDRNTGQPKQRRDGRNRGWLTWRNWRDNMTFRQIYNNKKAGNNAIKGKFITYAKHVGPIRMCEEFRFELSHPDDAFKNATFSFDGRYWWASISARMTIPEPIHPHSDSSVGVDLGITYLGTTSNGLGPFKNPKAYDANKGRLKNLQRKLDSMRRANNPDNFDEKGQAKRERVWLESSRMKKLSAKILKLHQRIRDTRLDASHKMTAEITNTCSIVCLEDLNINGMLKNRKLSKAISDAALYEKRRQFEYKAKRTGGVTSFVDRWYPSSRLCNECGGKNTELKQGDRVWKCKNCHSINERDENAAKNIHEEGLRLL